MPQHAHDDSGHRVLRFRRKDGLPPPGPGRPPEPPSLSDLQDFTHAGEPDDYRHRMWTNIAAGAIVLLLIAAGLWLADTLATMRKNQDCVLSGRRGCTPVELPASQR
jgi:hypothetical protein